MRDKLTPKPSLVAFALLVAASLGLAGCGDHVGNKQATVTPTRFAITANEAGKKLRLSVPKSVRAGLVTVELTNTGKAFHEAQLIRLEPGHTPEDALKVIVAEGAPSPGWIHVAGGTGPAPPGGKRSATQWLRPGNYIAYNAPFQNEGMGLKVGLASFKVEGPADDSGELPKAVAKIEAYEYGFKVSGLTVGKNTIEFSNTGTEPHHVIAVPYKPGATLAEVRRRSDERREAPRRHSTSRTSPTPPGSTAVQSKSPSSISTSRASTPCCALSAIARAAPRT